MSDAPFTRRLPSARADPIDDARTARLLVESLLAVPLRAETIAVVLDHERRGLAIVSVDHDEAAVPRGAEASLAPCPRAGAIAVRAGRARRPARAPGHGDDVVLEVAEWLLAAARHDDVGAVLLASVRPGRGDELDDAERWLTLDELLGAAGVELLEWYVVGRGVSCPRVLVGEPPRWGA